MSELADALRQIGDLNAEMRVANYRLGKVESGLEGRASSRDLAELQTEVREIRKDVSDASERFTKAEQTVADRINRRDNLTKILLAVLGSGGVIYLILDRLLTP